MMIKAWFVRFLDNNRVILINAASLMGTLVVTSGLGFAFWWLVAQKFELAETGLASAIISAMFLLGTLGMMGMGTLLIGELARHPQMVASLIFTAVLIVGSVSFLLGLGFAVVAGYFGVNFAVLLFDWKNALLFAAGVSITAIALVLDQALLGLLRGDWQLWRNSVFALSKLLLLLLVGYFSRSNGAMVIYVTWMMGNILSLVFLFWLAGAKRVIRSNYRPQLSFFRKFQSTALAHHALNLSLQTVQFTMPIVVTVIISPEVNAGFYVAWLIASSLFIVPTALTQTLYAVSAADISILAQKIRFTLRMSFLGVMAGGLIVFLLARIILGFFNPSYALVATDSLRVFLLVALPVVIRAHYVAIHQIRRQINRAAVQFWIMVAFELSLATIGAAVGGLFGLSVGWALAVFIEGGTMAPLVFRTAFQSEDESLMEKRVFAEKS